jgi:tetratricopeptide (TPR) repeat protein
MEPLIVFISAASKELGTERRAVENKVTEMRFKPIRFDPDCTPAYADPPQEVYTRQVKECDIFVLLIGSESRKAVYDEFNLAKQEGKRLLVFVKQGTTQSEQVQHWIEELKQLTTLAEFNSIDELHSKLEKALQNEITLQYRDARSNKSRVSELEERLSYSSIEIKTITAKLTDIEQENVLNRVRLADQKHNDNHHQQAANIYRELLSSEMAERYSNLKAIILNGIGREAVCLGEFENAVQQFENALNASPNHLTIKINLALVCLQAGKNERAAEILQEISNMPANELPANLFNTRGLLLVHQGKYSEALQQFQEAIKKESTFVEAWLNSLFCLREQKLFDQEEQGLHHLIAEHPEFYPAYIELATLYFNQEKTDEALRYYTKAEEVMKIRKFDFNAIQPKRDLSVIYCGLGVIAASNNDLTVAQEKFVKGLEYRQDNARLHYNLGHVFMKKDLYEKAADAYRSAIRFGKDDEETKTNLAIALIATASSQPEQRGALIEEAEQILKEVVTKRPCSMALGNLVSLLLKQQRHSEAENYLNEVLENSPSCLEALEGMYELSREIGDDRRSNTIGEMILVIDRGNFAVNFDRAKKLYDESNYADAINALQKALQHREFYTNHHPHAYRLLAHCHKKAGDVAKALEVLIEGTKRFPNSILIQEEIKNITT